MERVMEYAKKAVPIWYGLVFGNDKYDPRGEPDMGSTSQCVVGEFDGNYYRHTKWSSSYVDDCKVCLKHSRRLFRLAKDDKAVKEASEQEIPKEGIEDPYVVAKPLLLAYNKNIRSDEFKKEFLKFIRHTMKVHRGII